MPAYNRAHVISTAVESVLQQSFTDFELIIVNDGSTDNTIEKLQQYTDKRIKIITQANAGVCAARNTGIATAEGEWIAFLDTDDRVTINWLQDFYNKAVINAFDVLVCKRALISQPDNVKHSFLAGTFAARAALLNKIGGYDTAIQFGENTELRWHLLQHGARFGEVEGTNMIYDDVSGEGSVNVLKKVKSFLYLKNKYAAMFKSNPKLAQRYWQVAGVDSFRLGEKAQSRQLIWEGYRKYPWNIKALARALWYSVKTRVA